MKRQLLVLGTLTVAIGCGSPSTPGVTSYAHWGGTIQFMQQVTGVSAATILWTGTVFWDEFSGTNLYYVRPGSVKVTYDGKITSALNCTATGTQNADVLSTPGAGGVGAGSQNFITVEKDGSYSGSLHVEATIDVVTTCPIGDPAHDLTFVGLDLPIKGQLDTKAPRMKGNMDVVTLGTSVYTGSWDFEAGRTASLLSSRPLTLLAGLGPGRRAGSEKFHIVVAARHFAHGRAIPDV